MPIYERINDEALARRLQSLDKSAFQAALREAGLFEAYSDLRHGQEWLCDKSVFCAWSPGLTVPPAMRRDDLEWVRVSPLREVGFPRDGVEPGELLRHGARQELTLNPPFPGHSLELAGRSWVMPVVRYCDGQSPLPSVLWLEESGECTKRLESRYQAIFDDAGWLAAQIYGSLVAGAENAAADVIEDGEPSRYYPRAVSLVTRGLALNYRVDRGIANALQLWTTRTLQDGINALVDVPGFYERLGAVQKKMAEQSSLGRGSQELSSTTNRVGGSSPPVLCAAQPDAERMQPAAATCGQEASA